MFNKLKIFGFALVLVTGMFAVGADAQRERKAVGTIKLAPEAQAVRLEQCRNGGTVDASNDCNVASAWVTGNVGAQNSHWSEGQFVAYRAVLTDLGAGQHSILIGYDAKQSGRHALDYLGSYNHTETNADPCVDGVCPAGGAVSSPIPADPYVTSSISPNTGLPIQVIPGDMTLFGGAGAVINSVVYEGTFTGTSATEERRVRVTFTLASSQASVVLSWGGHIGWQGDWGVGQSAGDLSGSPYHMRVLQLVLPGGVVQNIGNQDRSLAAAAVDVSGGVIITKRVETVDNTDASTQQFTFDASAFFPDPNSAGSFFLVDNVAGAGGVSQASSPVFQTPSQSTVLTVTEQSTLGWTLLDISCNDANSTVNLVTATATVVVDGAEIVTCTFVNGQQNASAASATVAGRVMTSTGLPISGATVIIQNLSTGESRYLLTNTYGLYGVKGLPVGDFYAVTVMHRRYRFPEGTQYFTLEDNLTDLDFTAR